LTLQTYDSWNFELPVVPLRSRLYHLEPIGIGTPYVESLTSYICRLALAHCVLASALMRYEILPLSIRRARNSSDVTRYPSVEFAVKINDKGVIASGYVERLQTLTLKTNLLPLTMLIWRGEPLRDNITKYMRAWCPECYQQWLQSEQSIYEPLLWSLAAVTVCPYHRKRLQSRCPHCGQQQRLIEAKMRPGYCAKCQQWLGCLSHDELNVQEALIELELEWHIWVTQRIGEVLAAAPSKPSLAIKKKIAEVLRIEEKPYSLDPRNKLLRRLQFKVLFMFAYFSQ